MNNKENRNVSCSPRNKAAQYGATLAALLNGVPNLQDSHADNTDPFRKFKIGKVKRRR